MARRKLAHAQHEREKLLQAYFADALPLEVFKREQTRIAKEIDSARAEIAEAESTDSPYREMLETALSYMRDARRGYAQADPYVKRLWNRTLIERITIKGGQLSGVELKQPYHGLFLLASSNGRSAAIETFALGLRAAACSHCPVRRPPINPVPRSVQLHGWSGLG
jgi:hypothetical protein